MKRFMLLSALSVLILFACFSGVQGQYQMSYLNDYWGYSPSYSSYSPTYYSSYYPYYYSYYNPSFYPSYLPYRYYNYPYYYYGLESFPLGTFGLFHGGNFY